MSGKGPLLDGLICDIHDVLVATVAQGEEYDRLPQAHTQTVHLMRSLIDLRDNVGLHIEQILRSDGVNHPDSWISPLLCCVQRTPSAV
jgi:hypothetical protein